MTFQEIWSIIKSVPRYLEFETLLPKKIGGDLMIRDTAIRVGIIIKEKGLKQCAIANKAGFSARELNDILCGRKVFRADHVLPICNALGVTPNDLFGITTSDQKGA